MIGSPDDLPCSSERLRVKWLSADGEIAALHEQLLAVPGENGVALIVVRSSRNALAEVIAPFIAGTYALSHFITVLASLLCRARQTGLIIDVRTDPVEVSSSRDLPRGWVVLVDGGGETAMRDLCGTRGFVDLAAMISRSRSAPT